MIGGIVLAAGYSSRMGAFKPLLELGGLPAIRRALRCLKEAGAVCAAVTGHRREELAEAIAAEGAEELYNPDYDGGMFTSVRRGVAHFAALGAEGVLLLPCDCPAVPAEAVREVLSCAGEEFAVPVYRGKKGHPLWIPRRYFDEILAHDGSQGLKGVTRRHEDRMLRLSVPFEGVVLDMDRPEDYRKLLELEALPALTELAGGRRFYLVRHGATELHSGKVIMGRYDARLSDLGRQQMEDLGARLAPLGLRTRQIWASPLRRARDSAAILSRHTGLPVTEAEDLAEISLGAWDGRLIEEVRREFPEEYEKRGRQLMSYKFDNDCESFYDVQYRACAALRDILLQDDSPELLLVSHAGVLKCLWGSLQGRDIDWAFSRFRPEKGDMVVLDC